MPETYQGKYVFRCNTTDCIVMAIEERRKRANGLSGGVVARDRCKHPEKPCPTTIVADEADKEAFLRLGYKLIATLDHIVSE